MQNCQMASIGRLTANQNPSEFARHDICCAAQSSKGYKSEAHGKFPWVKIKETLKEKRESFFFHLVLFSFRTFHLDSRVRAR